MNTTQLECFMAVANYLNFSRAAEQLRLTQPAVSHKIRSPRWRTNWGSDCFGAPARACV